MQFALKLYTSIQSKIQSIQLLNKLPKPTTKGLCRFLHKKVIRTECKDCYKNIIQIYMFTRHGKVLQ